jgi:hypothetical protein
MVGASSLEVVVSRPLEGVEGVGLPFLAWGVEVLSWPLEGGVEVGVEVGSSPWLTPHANTEPL